VADLYCRTRPVEEPGSLPRTKRAAFRDRSKVRNRPLAGQGYGKRPSSRPARDDRAAQRIVEISRAGL